MGYTTTFKGRVEIEPPLNPVEIAYLQKFSRTRRMLCKQGPYFVDRAGDFGQDREATVLDYNEPPEGQPSLWCQWVPTEDGTALVWDEGEKFYESETWMQYLIDHFLRAECHASMPVPSGYLLPPVGMQYNHVLNGQIKAQGEDPNDRWTLIVKDNIVSVKGR